MLTKYNLTSTSFFPGTLALGYLTLEGANGAKRDDDLQLAKELLDTCIYLYNSTASGIAPDSVHFNTDKSSNEDYVIEDGKFLLRYCFYNVTQ